MPGSAPPAASIASATREPAGSRTSPGRRTLPDTATTTYPADEEDDGTPLAAGATGSTCGRARQASTPASTATATANTASARTAGVPNSQIRRCSAWLVTPNDARHHDRHRTDRGKICGQRTALWTTLTPPAVLCRLRMTGHGRQVAGRDGLDATTAHAIQQLIMRSDDHDRRDRDDRPMITRVVRREEGDPAGQTRRMQTPITPGPVWAATTAPTSET